MKSISKTRKTLYIIIIITITIIITLLLIIIIIRSNVDFQVLALRIEIIRLYLRCTLTTLRGFLWNASAAKGTLA